MQSAWLSLQVASAATMLAALIAVPLAWFVARRRLRWLEVAVLLPVVMPPTVVGFALVVLLGNRGPAGWLGVPMVFTVGGAIIAAAVVALPLVYLPTRAAFAAIDPDLRDATRILGASRSQSLWHVDLPLARHGIAAGLLLGFARGLGEFGATLMVLGWLPGKTTLPIAVYAAFERGDLIAAAYPAGLLAMLAVLLVIAHNAVAK
ncbi:MAG: molybdate ABC transporter permease subunit [Planctomycetota bacterium]